MKPCVCRRRRMINESAASSRKPLFNLMDQKKLCRKELDLRPYFVSRFTPRRASMLSPGDVTPTTDAQLFRHPYNLAFCSAEIFIMPASISSEPFWASRGSGEPLRLSVFAQCRLHHRSVSGGGWWLHAELQLKRRREITAHDLT